MTPVARVAAQAVFVFSSGWLLHDPASVPTWQIGLALLLACVGVSWMYLHER